MLIINISLWLLIITIYNDFSMEFDILIFTLKLKTKQKS